jgi:hypothetical protein
MKAQFSNRVETNLSIRSQTMYPAHFKTVYENVNLAITVHFTVRMETLFLQQ